MKWDTNEVRIRHVPTGKYLYVYPAPVDRPTQTAREIETLYWTGMTDDPKSKRTIFTLKATDNQGQGVPKSQVAIRIEHEIVVSGEKATLHLTNCKKHKDILEYKPGEGVRKLHRLGSSFSSTSEMKAVFLVAVAFSSLTPF